MIISTFPRVHRSLRLLPLLIGQQIRLLAQLQSTRHREQHLLVGLEILVWILWQIHLHDDSSAGFALALQRLEKLAGADHRVKYERRPLLRMEFEQIRSQILDGGLCTTDEHIPHGLKQAASGQLDALCCGAVVSPLLSRRA